MPGKRAETATPTHPSEPRCSNCRARGCGRANGRDTALWDLVEPLGGQAVIAAAVAQQLSSAQVGAESLRGNPPNTVFRAEPATVSADGHREARQRLDVAVGHPRSSVRLASAASRAREGVLAGGPPVSGPLEELRACLAYRIPESSHGHRAAIRATTSGRHLSPSRRGQACRPGGLAPAVIDFGLPIAVAFALALFLPAAELAVAGLLLPVGTAWWGRSGHSGSSSPSASPLATTSRGAAGPTATASASCAQRPLAGQRWRGTAC